MSVYDGTGLGHLVSLCRMFYLVVPIVIHEQTSEKQWDAPSNVM